MEEKLSKKTNSKLKKAESTKKNRNKVQNICEKTSKTTGKKIIINNVSKSNRKQKSTIKIDIKGKIKKIIKNFRINLQFKLPKTNKYNEKKIEEKKLAILKQKNKKNIKLSFIFGKKNKSKNFDINNKETSKLSNNEELIVYSNPRSQISEAIKSIKTNLQFAAIDKNIKTIMITSSIPGEGKSFIAANLAFAFAGSDQKVLVIDCDLRKGRQHEIFRVDNNKGLSNLLIDHIKIRQNYIKDTQYPNIKVIPSGMIPPNTSELLGSTKNKKLIETLRKEYDLIIFDCPPVNGLADALVMTSLADSIIIVCAQNKTKISLLNDTKKILNQLNAKVTGIIMNKVDNKNSDTYYGYYK